jgi:hypothetical protein
MHDKFIKLGMQSHHVILGVLTKYYIKLMHILAVILFLIPTIIEFY